MDRKYLPSRIFIIRIVAILIVIATVFGVSKLSKYIKSKSIKNVPTQVTIETLTQKDSNKNGIPDWEEYLWGLDPNKNGPENKEFILAKKKDLQKNNDTMNLDGTSNISQNEILSRQFFAAIVSLQQTGNLSDESIKEIGEAVGKNVISTDIPDIYNNGMMNIVEDGTTAKENYYNAFAKLIKKYSDRDIGSELTIIMQGFSNKDPQALYAAKSIGDAYQEFGAEFIKIPTPRSLVSIHVSAANNYEKSGQTIKKLTKGLSDPIIAMSAILDYKKYNEGLSSDLEKISDFLQ